jgi:hypothetical protein
MTNRSASRSGALSRWSRPFAVSITVAVITLAAVELAFGIYGPPNWRAAIGNDLRLYAEQVQIALAGGPWYHDRQLHGPYAIEWGDILYPPVTILFFAPWVMAPFAAWLAIPLGVTGFFISRWRPGPWAWVLIALCILWPSTLLKAISGNPSLWVMMLVALGLRYGWPAALILLKPSFLPFALIGVRSKPWWIAAAGLGVFSLFFLAPTIQYPQVILDARSPEGLGYSLADVPMVLIPAIAWFWRTRTKAEGPEPMPSAPLIAVVESRGDSVA